MAGRPESLWTASVGLGYSSCSVADGRLLTVGFDRERGLDTVYCLDAKTGAPIWKHSYQARIWNESHGGGTLTTPAVDGDLVYASNREGRFTCFNAADGAVKWTKELASEYDLDPPRWGFAASPLVLDDMIVLAMGRVLAFAKGSERLLWRSDDYGDTYSTPATLTLDGAEALAVFTGKGLVVLDRKNGQERSLYRWKTFFDINAATPVVVDGARVFISSGYEHGCALLDVSGRRVKALWEGKQMRNHMAGCVLFEGHLYGFDEGVFKCLDLNGNEKWHERGLGKGAHIVADGKLVILTGDGELVIAEASPKGFSELSRADALDGGVYWTTPVLVDGLIYCRNSLGDIACRDHRGGGSGQ